MEIATQRRDIFQLDGILPRLAHHRPIRWSLRTAERLLGLAALQREYSRLSRPASVDAFLDEVLTLLDVRTDIVAGSIDQIPATGGVLVVANHPFGGLEGVALARLLRQRRPDVRILANAMLRRIPEMADLFIAVDPFDRADSARSNVGPLRQAVKWLRGGGLLLVFPAGEVSHLHLRRRRVLDPAWSPTIGRLARLAQTPVVPLHIAGRNGTAFQLAGLVHPRLRTLLLPRQFLNRRGQTLRLRIGAPLPWKRRLDRFDDDGRLTDYLRLHTYLLAEPPRRTAGAGDAALPPVAAGPSPAILERELARLPEDQCLVDGGDYQVWHARADQIPYLMLEIGRLREQTFREAGEGTGREIDLDGFDGHYDHILLWQRHAREVVGAYRVGRTDEILRRLGPAGLYTTTLFRYRRELLEALTPALELGRSFVRAEYQRSYQPLLLLWKGIGAFIVRHPRYRTLFGPVSISRDYQDMSRHLIAESLLRDTRATAFAHLVRPRNPLRLKPVTLPGSRSATPGLWGRDLEELSQVVADIEGGERGIPVLLRHYLGLGGKLLAFNLDSDFADVLDGLILVDLCHTDRKQLERYMTPEGADAFLAWQKHSGELNSRMAG